MTDPVLTWSHWLEENQVSTSLIDISPELGDQVWSPSEKDREAAWVLYTEIRTRISTQRLHYRSGDEETALDSLYKLFDLSRRTIEDKGPDCRHFATIAIQILNAHIRPLTAKWHKKKIGGCLQNDDDRREFRKELSDLQDQLVEFCHLLGSMAEGDKYVRSESCCSGLDSDPAASSKILGAEIPFDTILLDKNVSGHTELHNAELSAIQKRRNDKAIPGNLAGIACSGGGIRSATFCLGVTQALSSRGLLPQIDYLSTVSGGGYFGSFLSSYLNDPSNQNVGLESDELPFSESGKAEPEPIRQLRNNSKYLLKGGLLGQARMVGLLLFGIFVNLLTLLPFLFGALTLTKVLELAGVTAQGFQNLVSIALVSLSVLLLGLVLGLPIVYRAWSSIRDRIAGYERTAIAVAIALVAIWVLGSLLPVLYEGLLATVPSPGILLTLFALFPFVLAGLAFSIGASSFLGRILIVLAGIAGPVLILVTYMVLNQGINTSWQSIVVLVLISVLLSAWLWIINVNQISPHRYYRNRLAETYLLRKGHSGTIDPQPLSGLRGGNSSAPYHLINAALNLPSSKEPELRGRNSDFFLFSQHFCGSPVLGYCQTNKLEVKDKNLDLGTAMSISGAAASAFMGTQTIKGLAFWLSLLNIRLGYWLPNPKRLDEISNSLGARPFSLWNELFGRIDENGKFVNLSDGGHIENLGIYELLRRRCKFIIAMDGEADPDMNFGGLMKLIRYAKIDFGIDINMDLNDLERNDAGFTKAHFTLGKIDYGKNQTGYLLYIKSSLTGNERDYILDYQKRNPSFPHETTADQFFDEAQFEAYRALGEHIGDDLFHPELMKGAGVNTLSSWFSALAHSLRV
jgi:hypothetical protein